MARSTSPGRRGAPADEPRPKLPHERDQSAEDQTGDAQGTDSAAAEQSRERMRQGHDDLASGKQDTDRGPVTDAAYRKVRKLPK